MDPSFLIIIPKNRGINDKNDISGNWFTYSIEEASQYCNNKNININTNNFEIIKPRQKLIDEDKMNNFFKNLKTFEFKQADRYIFIEQDKKMKIIKNIKIIKQEKDKNLEHT